MVPFGSGTIAACVSLLFGVHDAVVSTLLLFVGWLVPLGVCGPLLGGQNTNVVSVRGAQDEMRQHRVRSVLYLVRSCGPFLSGLSLWYHPVISVGYLSVSLQVCHFFYTRSLQVRCKLVGSV